MAINTPSKPAKPPYHVFAGPSGGEKTARLRKQDVAPILALTFPEYEGRTFKLAIASDWQIHGYELSPDGGTWTEIKLVRQGGDGLAIVELQDRMPWNGKAYGGTIPRDVMIVSRRFFCGQDLGLLFTVAPGSDFMPPALPAAEVA